MQIFVSNLRAWVILSLMLFTTAVRRYPINRGGHDRRRKQSASDIHNLVNLKAGPSSSKSSYVWYHSGSLRNPLTGAEIVGIEGIEVVKAFPAAHRNKTINGYTSQKLFVYVDSMNRSCPIENFRIRPQSPNRPVNPLKTFTERVTHSIPTTSKLTSGGSGSGNIVTAIEWPSGRMMKTNKIGISESIDKVSPIERLFGICKLDVTHFMSASPKKRVRKWVSFSSTADSSRGRSQEYYSLSKRKSNPQIYMEASLLRGLAAISKPTSRSTTITNTSTSTSTSTSTRSKETNASPVSIFPRRKTSKEVAAATATVEKKKKKNNKRTPQRSSTKSSPSSISSSSTSTGADSVSSNRSKPVTPTPTTATKLDRALPAVPVSTDAAGRARQSIKEQRRLRRSAQVLMSYRRYGEGPPWFSTGRACVIEMNSFRFPLPQHDVYKQFHQRGLMQRFRRRFFPLPAHMLNLLDDIEQARVPIATVTSSSRKDTPAAFLLLNPTADAFATASSSLSPPVGNEFTQPWFMEQSDPIDAYRPWYSYLNPFRRRRRTTSGYY